MKTFFQVIIVIFILLCAVSAVRPYWNKYWLGKELEAACVYGTKNSIAATREFLVRKMEEEGYNLRGEDFLIEKSENNRVSISVTYSDEMSLFGRTIKSLDFTVERSASEVKQPF